MWLGLQTVSSLERCPLFRVSFIERFHCSCVLCSITHTHLMHTYQSPPFLSPSHTIRVSKQIMSSSDVPIVPGYFGEDQSDQRLQEEALKIGWAAFTVLLYMHTGVRRHLPQSSS